VHPGIESHQKAENLGTLVDEAGDDTQGDQAKGVVDALPHGYALNAFATFVVCKQTSAVFGFLKFAGVRFMFYPFVSPCIP
jgi:hypothetical protein